MTNEDFKKELMKDKKIREAFNFYNLVRNRTINECIKELKENFYNSKQLVNILNKLKKKQSPSSIK